MVKSFKEFISEAHIPSVLDFLRKLQGMPTTDLITWIKSGYTGGKGFVLPREYRRHVKVRNFDSISHNDAVRIALAVVVDPLDQFDYADIIYELGYVTGDFPAKIDVETFKSIIYRKWHLKGKMI
jgi:hypothetical protein